MINERQQELINELKQAGYGWEAFARSVEKSGRCSPKQHETMLTMKLRIISGPSSRSSYYDGDISDHEAMRSGDYF